MLLSEDFIERWEALIQDIEITLIPVQCIEKVVLTLKGKRQKTINVSKLVNRGLTYDEVEDEVNLMLDDLDEEIVKMRFALNIEEVAKIVQPYTDELLKEL